MVRHRATERTIHLDRAIMCAPYPSRGRRGIPPSYLKGFAQGSLDPAAAGLGMTAGFGQRFQAFAAA